MENSFEDVTFSKVFPNSSNEPCYPYSINPLELGLGQKDEFCNFFPDDAF